MQNSNSAKYASHGTLMVQGTTSDAGKSALVTGLCRLLRRRGVAVAPFKPQNMALNSAVTAEGGEIGRAQAVQAQASGLAPHVHMNPILLKPSSDQQAQVIVHGRALQQMPARDYHRYKTQAMAAVLESHNWLRERYSAVVVEGAGSPAEINLRDRDIANMGFAEAVDCPVILIADIDKGGVFAHLVGTLDVLSPTEQARIDGFVINRFRGDIGLLQPGLEWLEARTGKPVLGVLPYLHGLHLEAEDAIATAPERTLVAGDQCLKIIVPVLPRISNHTDFDPLRLHPQVDLEFIGPGQKIPAADLIILPGSKATRADLAWLRHKGWPEAIARHLRYGGKLLGICGGLQMLGQTLEDPLGIEGEAGTSAGLAYLDFTTRLGADKQLHQVTGELAPAGRSLFAAGAHDPASQETLAQPVLTGYEIHAGTSYGPALERPLFNILRTDGEEMLADGAVSEDGQIIASYVHGLFESPSVTNTILRWAGLANNAAVDYTALREAGIDRMADACEQHLDVPKILRLLGMEAP